MATIKICDTKEPTSQHEATFSLIKHDKNPKTELDMCKQHLLEMLEEWSRSQMGPAITIKPVRLANWPEPNRR